MMILGNAAGLWALAAVPAIVAIHFLQQRARAARTSTWFLIEKLAPDSARGRTWDRLRSSRPFWLQLAAALLATWVLVEPRWVHPQSAQTVVVVLDASASMAAFREPALRAARREFSAADGRAAHTTWVVMTTSPRQPPLYRGESRAEAEAALERWRPELGEHDLAPALRLARAMAAASGRTLLVTDRRDKVPPDQRGVGVGHAIENVGFSGGAVERTDAAWRWRALVQNHSATPQQRTWHVEIGGHASAEQTLDLAPGALTEISSAWPAEAAALTLVLSPDPFASDDRLALVRPVPKPLSVSIEGRDAAAEFFRKVAAETDGVTVVAGVAGPTLRITSLEQSEAVAEPRGGIFWPPADRRPQVSLSTDAVVPERDPLVAGLSWQGWIGSGPTGYAALEGDVPLLWQGRWPLVFLRPAREATPERPARERQLLLAFDWGTSNAGRLPAFVLMVERFLAATRDAQRAPYTANFDTGARVALAEAIPPGPLTLTFQPATGGEPVVRPIPAAERSELRAPGTVGTFTVSRGEELLVRGATAFADPRQGDFLRAETFEHDIAAERQAAIEHNTRTDPFAPAWLAVIVALLLGSWWVRPSRGGAAPAARVNAEALQS